MKLRNRENLEDGLLAFVIGFVLRPALPFLSFLIMLGSAVFIAIILFDSIPAVGG